MSKIVSVLALLVALGAVWWQARELREMRADLRRAEDRAARLEAEVERGKTALALLHKFTLLNSERIKGLARRKVVTVTAYSPRESETDSTPFITASNGQVRPGIVAVSRDLFESGWVFGKKVYIKNMGVFIIDDLMAESKREQLDIFMYDSNQALHFGVKKMEVFLLGA